MRTGLALVTATVLALTACGAGSPTGSASSRTPSAATTWAGKAEKIRTRTLPGLGTILVDGQGQTLYMFPPDHRHKVTCTGACAGTWPPLHVPKGSKPQAGRGVKTSLLGSVPNPNPAGGRVVTYHGWPLYLYVGDGKPGQANGQALDLNGGYWYVMRPSGKVIKHPVAEKKGHT
ncbi:MAG: COG4315 family predicted lipoprotein [Nocardioidaceae bacterium]